MPPDNTAPNELQALIAQLNATDSSHYEKVKELASAIYYLADKKEKNKNAAKRNKEIRHISTHIPQEISEKNAPLSKDKITSYINQIESLGLKDEDLPTETQSTQEAATHYCHNHSVSLLHEILKIFFEPTNDERFIQYMATPKEITEPALQFMKNNSPQLGNSEQCQTLQTLINFLTREFVIEVNKDEEEKKNTNNSSPITALEKCEITQVSNKSNTQAKEKVSTFSSSLMNNLINNLNPNDERLPESVKNPQGDYFALSSTYKLVAELKLKSCYHFAIETAHSNILETIGNDYSKNETFAFLENYFKSLQKGEIQNKPKTIADSLLRLFLIFSAASSDPKRLENFNRLFCESPSSKTPNANSLFTDKKGTNETKSSSENQPAR